MARHITTGIDVGTAHVRVVIAEAKQGKKRSPPTIVGTGVARSHGLRNGYVVSASDATRSIASAVRQAEKTAKVSVGHAYISIGGMGLDETREKSEVLISRADSEVTDFDINKALAESEKHVVARQLNRKTLHQIPLNYKIDGERVLGRPHGMKGTKLEVEALFVTCFEQHLSDLISAVEEAGVEVEDVMASPVAGSLVTLSKTQKMVGCVLVDIGAETTSIAVFEDNMPYSVKVFPMGSAHITNDIALGLRVSLEEAEQIKKGALTGTPHPKKKLDDIILSRVADICELIEKHLKVIGKSGLLPAGAILTGAGSHISGVEETARSVLKLPTKVASLRWGEKNQLRDPSWAVAYGLCLWGLTAESESPGVRIAKRTSGSILQWLKQFLP